MMFWRPETCHSIGCKCLPAAEVVHEKIHNPDTNISESKVQFYQEFECG